MEKKTYYTLEISRPVSVMWNLLRFSRVLINANRSKLKLLVWVYHWSNPSFTLMTFSISVLPQHNRWSKLNRMRYDIKARKPKLKKSMQILSKKYFSSIHKEKTFFTFSYDLWLSEYHQLDSHMKWDPIRKRITPESWS